MSMPCANQSLLATEGVRRMFTQMEETELWTAKATQTTDCLTKSMKPTQMLKVLDTGKYQEVT